MTVPVPLARWALRVLIFFVASLLLAVYAPDQATASAHRGAGFAVLHHFPRRVGGHPALSASSAPPPLAAEVDLSGPLTINAAVHVSARILTASAPRAPPQS